MSRPFANENRDRARSSRSADAWDIRAGREAGDLFEELMPLSVWEEEDFYIPLPDEAVDEPDARREEPEIPADTSDAVTDAQDAVAEPETLTEAMPDTTDTLTEAQDTLPDVLKETTDAVTEEHEIPAETQNALPEAPNTLPDAQDFLPDEHAEAPHTLPETSKAMPETSDTLPDMLAEEPDAPSPASAAGQNPKAILLNALQSYAGKHGGLPQSIRKQVERACGETGEGGAQGAATVFPDGILSSTGDSANGNSGNSINASASTGVSNNNGNNVNSGNSANASATSSPNGNNANSANASAGNNANSINASASTGVSNNNANNGNSADASASAVLTFPDKEQPFISPHLRRDGVMTRQDVLLFLLDGNAFESDRYRDGGEVTVSRLFADMMCLTVRYNTTARGWYRYNGAVWMPDEEGMRAEQMAKLFADSLCAFCEDFKTTDAFGRAAARLQSRAGRVKLLQDARDFYPITRAALDRDPLLFNVKNGVLRLDTRELLPHDPELLLSRMADVTYDPDAEGGAFLRFLTEVMEGDMNRVAYLTAALGYALLGETPIHECYMLYGSTTRNGKSTLLETVRRVFGTYAASVEPQTIALTHNDNRGARGDLARLDGIRFVQMSEPPRGMRLDAALLKKLTGQDTVTARNLYERDFEFTPCFKLYINTNYLPETTDPTLFTSDRVRVIPFNRRFTDAEQDRSLRNKLLTEESKSGILNLLLMGLDTIRDGQTRLEPPADILTATERYAHASDKICLFMDDCFAEDPKGVIPLKAAYEAYGAWCRQSGRGCENKRLFTDELRKRGLVREGVYCMSTCYRYAIVGYALENR